MYKSESRKLNLEKYPKVHALVKSGMAMTEACKELGVWPSGYLRWREKNEPSLLRERPKEGRRSKRKYMKLSLPALASKRMVTLELNDLVVLILGEQGRKADE